MTADKGTRSDYFMALPSDRAGGLCPEPAAQSQPEALIPSAGDPHPYYGGCDGFGPLWMCSECTGLIGVDGGTFKDTHTGEIVSPDDAAGRVGDFLMNIIESAAVAGWGCCDTPQSLEGFMRRSLWASLPGDPWRDNKDAAKASASSFHEVHPLLRDGSRKALAIVIDAAEPMRLREEADCRLGISHRAPIKRAIQTLAQAMSAGTAETGTGSGRQPASAVRQDAPDTPDLSTPLPSGSIER